MRIAIEGPDLSEVNFNEILDIFKEKKIGALDCELNEEEPEHWLQVNSMNRSQSISFR